MEKNNKNEWIGTKEAAKMMGLHQIQYVAQQVLDWSRIHLFNWYWSSVILTIIWGSNGTVRYLSPTQHYRTNHFLLPISLAMLFLVFVCYLAQGVSIDASQIPSTDAHSLESNQCADLTHCRTIWNIVWSCLVTIFLCTWVAVHPNIPCPKKRKAKNCFQRWIWNPVVCLVSPPTVRLCTACTRVYSNVGNQTVFESSGNNQ